MCTYDPFTIINQNLNFAKLKITLPLVSSPSLRCHVGSTGIMPIKLCYSLKFASKHNIYNYYYDWSSGLVDCDQ